MATYIVVGEADATIQGGEWLQRVIFSQQGEEAANDFALKFKEVHTDVCNTRQFSWMPVFELFLSYSDDLFACIPEGRIEDKGKEVESFFALVLSLLMMMDETDDIDKGTVRLCQLLSDNTTQQPDLRLRLLMNLYNAFTPNLEPRYKVFKFIVDYANKAGLFDQVVPYLEYLESWMADWEMYIDVNDKKALYGDISKYVRVLGKRVDAFQHLKKYHWLYQGATAAELGDAAVTAATVQVLTDAISIPSVIQFDDILGFDTVKLLSKSKDAKHTGLVKLCEVFLSGTVQILRDFHKKNEALFKEYDLSIEDAMSKIKLLTMASMALGKAEMTLAEVAKGLEESEEVVESWVVRAISEGVIDGRIDQLHSKVLVKYAFQRKFEKDEWAFLDSKLSSWIDNLESVIKFIGDEKQKKEPTPLPIKEEN